MGQKGNLAVFEGSMVSPKPERSRPPKLVCMILDINPYLHEFFEPIPIN